MATISYEDLLPEVIPMAPEAPDLLLIRYIRAAVIELCEKTSAYQKDLDPITAIADQFEYDFDTPAGTVIHKVQWMTFDGRDLEPTSPSLVEQRYEKWRTSTTSASGKPEVFVQQGQEKFWLVPKPGATEADVIRTRVVLKPTHTSSACEAEVMNDYRDTIVNGTLFRVLRTPGHTFTDMAGAQIYGGLFSQQLVDAERKARYGDQPVFRKVKYGGLKGVRDTRKYSGRGLHRSRNF
mgnify:CR=1 FL=1